MTTYAFIFLAISSLCAINLVSGVVEADEPNPLHIQPPQQNVQSMCAAALCPVDRPICRVINRCRYNRRRCFPVVACLPCVPDGADAVCNARRYINAVLSGNHARHRDLKPLFCNPRLDNDENGCPLGSVCATSFTTPNVGTCCYGKPEVTILPYPLPPVENNDRKCVPSRLCGRNGCGKGEKCLPDKPERDCDNTFPFTCQEVAKPGRCPPVPLETTDFCLTARVGRFCESDGDCEESKKCCTTRCGGTGCVLPVIPILFS